MFNRKKQIVFIFSLLVFIFFVNLYSDIIPSEKIILAFRIDDYGLDPANFYIKLFKTIEEKNLAITLGVVPYEYGRSNDNSSIKNINPLSQKEIYILKEGIENKNVEIALHGYFHKNNLRNTLKFKSEFYGVDYRTQLKKIASGKKYLEETFGIPITTFIPPWNTYDATTLQILEDLNFSCISAANYGLTAVKESTLKYLPYTTDLLHIKDAVKNARKVKGSEPGIVVVLFHAFDFYENQEYYENEFVYTSGANIKANIYYKDFEDLLTWVASQEDIEVLTIDQVIKLNLDLDWKRCLNNKKIKGWIPAPSFVYPSNYYYYLSSDTFNYNRIKCLIYPILFYLLLLGFSITISYFLGMSILTIKRNFIFLFKYGIPFITMLFFIYSFRDFVLGSKGLMTIITLLGVYSGGWIALFKVKNKKVKLED